MRGGIKIRNKRKADHLALALKTQEGPLKNGFDDINLVPDSVPEIAWQEIDLGTNFLDKKLGYPLLINALTGGTESSYYINKSLAGLARQFGLGMAVGSMTIALEEPSTLQSFSVTRKENPDGIIIANCSANLKAEQACRLVDLIAADGLQLHFNVAQEMAMAEGDRDFRGILDNVARIVTDCPVPVIAKEVGFGLSQEAVQKLFQVGIRIIDNGGSGGTNFIAIEDQRGGNFDQQLYAWGLPTAVSLAEIIHLQLPIQLIATGGIRNALDIAKAIAMGADIVGMTGWFLKLLQQRDELHRQMAKLLYQLEAIFLMSGARDCKSLQAKPVIIVGRTAEWLRAMDIDPSFWSKTRLK